MAYFALQTDGSKNWASLGALGNFGSNLANGFYFRCLINTTQTTQGEFGFGATGGQVLRIYFNKNKTEALLNHAIGIVIRDTGSKILRGSVHSPTINFNDGVNHKIEIFVTMNTNTIIILIDNVPQTIEYNEQQTPVAFVNLSSTNHFQIGRSIYNGVGGEYISCKVDNIAIGISSSNLYGKFELDEGVDTTINDSSGKNNHGTLNRASISDAYPIWATGLAYYPSISSIPATNITDTSVTMSGNLSSDGNSPIERQGFCIGESENPTLSDTIVDVTPGLMGVFSASATGLTVDTEYHHRPFATNGIGTFYGLNQSFTAGAEPPLITNGTVTSITRTTAIFSASVTSDNGAPIIERGFVFGTSANPTVDDTKHIVSGTTGDYTYSKTGLTQNTTYHMRSYAINGANVSYGNDNSFTTPPNIIPVLTTSAVGVIRQTTAIATATMTDGGGTTVTERGFVIDASENPTTSDTKFVVVDYLDIYKWLLSSLTPDTTYHLRPYATNSTGTGYGSDVTFTTLPAAVPKMTGYYDMPAMDITDTQATLTGYINDNCGATITERGFVLSASPNPTTSDTKIVVAGDEAWMMNADATGLTPDTHYHFKAFATNSVGTAYGKEEIFKTEKAGRKRIRKISPFFGLNYGNQITNGGAVDWKEINADIEYFKSIGLKHARVPSMPYEWVLGRKAGSYGVGRWQNMREVVTKLMAAGVQVQFTIQYGGQWGTVGEYASWDAGWRDWFREQIEFAMSIGIKRIQIDNETEGNVWESGATRAQVRYWQQACSVWAREAQYNGEYYDGIITVALIPDNDTEWPEGSRLLIHEIGFDMYGTMTEFVTKNDTFFNKHGDRGFCSEWGMNNPENSPHYRSSKYYTQQCFTKWQWLEKKQRYHASYYHTWKNVNDSGYGQQNQDNWGAAMLTGEIQEFFFKVTGQRSPIVY